ncbi:MAG: hypothetical protein WBA84_06745 [Carnobacterium sp.]|uniref:hypothetical protein n=1 Tax=Carnobacterium sp. TaxID=48221 RepID=UPI003C70F168
MTCNHPECFEGVRYEQSSFGLLNITKCEYCTNEEDSWERSKAMMKQRFEAKGLKWEMEVSKNAC